MRKTSVLEESADAAEGGLLMCCPVCGRVRLRVESADASGGESVGWECYSCGASGVMSSLRPGGSAVVLDGLPDSVGWESPARPVAGLYVPWVRPVEDSLGAWSDAGQGVGSARLICAASGVGVGTLCCESTGVWVARPWFGGRSARLLCAEAAADLAVFCSEGCAGVLPVGCYVSAERPPASWPVGWWGV